MDTLTDEVNITTAWAVDYCQNMTLSFRANYPETEVGCDFDFPKSSCVLFSDVFPLF